MHIHDLVFKAHILHHVLSHFHHLLLSPVALLSEEVFLLQLQQVHTQRGQKPRHDWVPSAGDWHLAGSQSGIQVWLVIVIQYGFQLSAHTVIVFSFTASARYFLVVGLQVWLSPQQLLRSWKLFPGGWIYQIRSRLRLRSTLLLWDCQS